MRSRWAAPSIASVPEAVTDVRRDDAARDGLVGAPIREVSFAVVDLETTGLSSDRGDRVWQIAVVTLDPDGSGGWRAGERFGATLDPRRHLSPGALRACGADAGGAPGDGAPTLAHLSPRILPLLEGRVLVLHNAPFGITFLRSELEPLGYALERHLVVDVVALARAYLPGPLGLPDVAARAGQPSGAPGIRASRDAEAIAGILRHVLEQVGPDAPLSRLFPSHARHGLRTPDPYGSVRICIEEALLSGAELAIRYYSPWSACVTERRIRPLEVDEELYLEAFCSLRGDRRRFRIDRIRRAEVVAAG